MFFLKQFNSDGNEHLTNKGLLVRVHVGSFFVSPKKKNLQKVIRKKGIKY